MPATWKTVRVFISSTFRDMQAERDHLVRFVFPKLRQELLQRRIHLVDVDLRWGVTSEQDALSVCREVVDECRPRFLCMLGGRYGWVPPGEARSITADEVHYGVLDRDLENRGFAYFYFRDPSATAAMVEVAPGEFCEPAGSHGAVALDEIKTAISAAGLQPFTYRAQWDDQSRRLIGLKDFGDRVYADLQQSIDQEFGPTTGEKPDEFAEENAAMEAFIEERVQRFVLGSRQPVWNELRHHAESTGGNGYLCLTGAAGSGKSALLGKFCQDYRAVHPQDLVIAHFVGASPGSTDVRRTLRRLCHELVTGGALTAEIPEDPEKLRVAFAEILQQAAARKRVVILLDAINQFDPTTQLAGWSWLPEELPATARIILSTLAEKPETISSIEAIRHRRVPPKESELQPLTTEDAEAIIRDFLQRYRKSMTADQSAALLAKADAGTPLYLLVALEDLRTLGTYEEITDRIAQLPPDTRALFIWILKRLEDDDGFRDASGRKTGQELVSRFVSLLGASRHGLSQQELVELLSPGDPQGNVAALAQLLRPYLMQRGEILDFYHGQFRDAAAISYLPTESQQLAAHDQLATYFRDRADPERNQSWNGDTPRPFLEVVFHLVGAQHTDDYCQALCDLRFVEARCRMGQVFELIADYRLAQEYLPEAQADLCDERVREERDRRWTAEIIEYARQWSNRRDRLARAEAVTGQKPQLPEPVPTCEMWSEEKIQAECDRIIYSPTRRDRLEAFAGFVGGQCYPLLEHSRRPSFVRQHAFNAEPGGAVHDAALALLREATCPTLLRRWPSNSEANPKPSCRYTLKGHRDRVAGVDVTPDGRLAVSASWDNTLRVWDPESGACLRTLEGHGDQVSSVCITPDGRHAVSVSWETLLVWDLESGACLRTLEGHSDPVNGVCVTPDGRRAVSGSDDDSLRVWDLASGQCLYTLKGPSGGFFSVSVTADGRRVVSGGGDDTIRIWDLENGTGIGTLKGHSSLVKSVSATPNGRRVVSGSWDNTIKVWDLKSGACLRTLRGHVGQISSVRITPDGRRMVSGGEDRLLRVWDVESGTCLRTLEGHSFDITSVSVTANGRQAVSGSYDKTLRMWDLRSGKCHRIVERHDASVLTLCVTTDGRLVVTGSEDETLRVWNSESGNSLHTLEGHTDCVSSVCVTPDGRRAVSVAFRAASQRDHTPRVWDLDRGECIQTLEGHDAVVQSVGVTPDGRRAVSASWDKTLRVWDVESGVCLRTMQGHTGYVKTASVTPDGLRAISAASEYDQGGDNALRLWDLESGKCINTLEGHTDLVTSVCVTPDGRRAVSASCDKTLRVWDLEGGVCLRTLHGHADIVEIVTLTPDGMRAVSVERASFFRDWDDILRLWDLESGECIHTLEGHGGYVNSVRVTPDGRRVVSAGEDGTLRVWDLVSGRVLAVYQGAMQFSSMAFGGTGNLICVGTATGEVLFLKLNCVPSGPAILTVANPVKERCPVCGQDFRPPPLGATAIQDCSAFPTLHSEILSPCPHCQHPLHFKRHFTAAEDYAEMLLRGLEFSRREKSYDHEETLAHLVALTVHLKNSGNMDEAAEFQREHDGIAAKLKEIHHD